jgi:hypothetical protein
MALAPVFPAAYARERPTTSTGVDDEAHEEEEKERDPRFDVRFDVGVEVLFTMIRLRDGSAPNTTYEAEVDSAFGEFASHAAIDAVGNLLDRGARYEVLLNTLLCRSPAPGFRKEFPYWAPDSSAAGATEEDRERLLAAVRSFYRDSGFQEFWDIRWEGLEEDSLRVFDGSDVSEPQELGGEPELRQEEPERARGLEAVEDSLYERIHSEMAREPYQMYFGSRGNATYLVVPTWQSPVDTALATRSAGRELLAWVVPLAPDSSGILDRERWEHSRARELSLAVVEPLADWFWPYLAEYQSLFPYLTFGRGRLGLWESWGQCFVDHLRRAVESRVLLATEGSASAEAFIKAREEEGFGLLQILYDALAEYEANRVRYLSLPDFCPSLISSLGSVRVEVSSREAAFGVKVRPGDRGLVVTWVFEGLAADRAGIEVGDTLLKINGRPVDEGTDLETLARSEGMGGRLEVGLLRGTRVQKRVLLLGADLINYRFVWARER